MDKLSITDLIKNTRRR